MFLPKEISSGTNHRLKITLFEPIMVAICLFLFVLTIINPHLEPGIESFNEWVGARILLDGEGMPTHSLPLGYVFFSAALMFVFEFKYFILIETLLASVFFGTCCFLTIRLWVGPLFSLLVTLAFLPTVMAIEGHNSIFAVGFFFLYLKDVFAQNKRDIIPTWLMLASTCHTAILPFFISHIFLATFETILQKKKLVTFPSGIKESAKLALIIAMLALYSAAIFYPANRSDNNHFTDNMPWAPTELDSTLKIAALQIQSSVFLSKRITNEQAQTQDWFYTVPNLFGTDPQLGDAIVRAPHIFLENLWVNLRQFLGIPNTLLFQYRTALLDIFSLSLVAMAILATNKTFVQNKQYAEAGAIISGTIVYTVVLLLTVAGNIRYSIIFLPLILSFVFNFIYGLSRNYLPHLASKSLRAFFPWAVLVFSFVHLNQNNLTFQPSNLLELPLKNGPYTRNWDAASNIANPNDIVMTSEARWFKAFLETSHSNTISIHDLPPYFDEELLNTLINKVTVLFVSDRITKPIKHTTVSTNTHIRYTQYFKPMENYATEQGWVMENLDGLGKLYSRIGRDIR